MACRSVKRQWNVRSLLFSKTWLVTDGYLKLARAFQEAEQPYYTT